MKGNSKIYSDYFLRPLLYFFQISDSMGFKAIAFIRLIIARSHEISPLFQQTNT
ncbi:hypothetical protein SAMN05192588_0876 [Nonlabens sp. Hel1_33_55]|nr:hypothetical protein SAMN05192588_0876 [Nonlabens sp. Hel1_33_55]